MQTADYLRVPLWRRDGSLAAHALVDQEDGAMNEYRWHVGSNGYARRNAGTVPILMHRAIMGLAPGDPREVDHVNRDRLDNRRANLRIVSHRGNMQNRPSTRGSYSQFRGVEWRAERQVWVARPRVDGQRYRIGAFHSEIEAALAVEAWRRDHMPYATPDPAVAEIVALVRRYVD